MTRRNLIILYRLISAGVKDFIRNSWMASSAIIVLVISLLTVQTGIVSYITVQKAIPELSKNLSISVYFNEGVEEAETASLQNEFRSHPLVDSVDFISSERALELFLERFSDNEDIQEALRISETDELLSSIEVRVTDLSQINEVAQIAEDPAYDDIVDLVSLGKIDAQVAIDRAIQISNLVIRSTIVLSAIFAVISAIILFNTIRLAVFTRREEVSIMRLIGATPNFIRGQFLVQAGLYGLISSLISIVVIYGLIIFLERQPSYFLEDILIITYDFLTAPHVILIVTLTTITTGVVFSLLACVLALNKYLKFAKEAW